MVDETRTDIAMKCDPDIKGTCQVKSHEDWIKCKEVKFEISRSVGSPDDRKLGGASLAPLVIKRTPCIASPDLLSMHLKAKPEDAKMDVEIDFVESGGEVNVHIKLTEAYIKEFKFVGDSENMEEVIVMDCKELLVKVADTERSYNFQTREAA